MSRKANAANANVDVYLGSAVLPSSIRRARTDHRGALTIHVDSEEHDLDLLRSIAAAVRDNPEVVDTLREYADLIDARDLAERTDDRARVRSLDDEAVDLRSDIEESMEWQPLGDGMVATLRPAETARLVEALTGNAEVAA